MDPATSYMLTYAVFGFIILALFLYAFVYNRFFANREGAGNGGARADVDGDDDRRLQPRARRQQVRRVQMDDDDDDGYGMDDGMRDVDDALGGPKKIGAKKQAKLEAKEARRQQNEAIKAERTERQEREKLADEERKAKEAEEEAKEKAAEDEAKRKQEEKEKAEYEEYLKLKAAFSIDEEGTLQVGQEEEENLLQQFIDFVKTEKIVTLEDLAARFKLRVQDAIDRLQRLIADGRLTGVVDERGKFVYVSVEELAAVADFIRQRGRVSFSELVNSSQLIVVPQKKPVALTE